MKDTKIIFICSPYKGFGFKKLRNIRYAKKLTKEAIRRGYQPITPHLYITKVLKDWKKKDRKTGIDVGAHLLSKCQYMLVGTKYGITSGMQIEIEKAGQMDVEMLNSTHNKRDILKAMRDRQKMLDKKSQQQQLKIEKKLAKKRKMQESKKHLKLSIKYLFSVVKKEA